MRRPGFVSYVACEGLGNRIRTHLVAHAYALHTGRRLAVDWAVVQAFGARFSDLFQLNDVIEMGRWSLTARMAGISRRVSRVRFNNRCLHAGQTIADLPRSSALVVEFGEAFTPHGVEDQGAVLGPYRDAVTAALVPRPQALAKITALRERFAPITVGLHVRRGDYHVNRPEGIVPFEWFSRAATRIRKVVPDVRFYVASDDHEAVRPLLDEFDCIIQAKPPRQASRQPWAVFGYDEKSDRDTVAGAMHALVDCWALSQTHIIWGYDKSSFSQLSAFLGKNRLLSPTEEHVDSICRELTVGRPTRS